MIEKLNFPPYGTQNEWINKINELVDAVNKHENIIKQIGEWGSSKGECLWCENLTKVKLDDPYAEQRNLPNIDAGELAFLSKENSDLKDELERTRKALDVAVDALKELKPQKAKGGGYWAVKSTDAIKLINTALKQITALEQKDVK